MASPIDMIPENPIERLLLHSMSPAAMAPDCEMSARSPDFAVLAAKLAFSRAGGTTTPITFGPMPRGPCGLAVFKHGPASASAPRPSPEVIMTAAADPVHAA